MTDFSTGIPNIRVIIREASDQNLIAQVPNIAVKLVEGSQYNVNITPNTVVTLRTGSFNSYADLAGTAVTASYALFAQVVSGSIESASFAYTSSNVLGGTQNYLPIWDTDTTLSSSRVYQTGSSILIGATTQHTPEAPDTLGVFALTGSDSYNLISGHGNVDTYLQLNIKNFGTGSESSTDIVATANVGDETSGFINLGINSNTYNVPGAVGTGLDGYLYLKDGNDLLIGNTAPDKNVIIFTGGENSTENGRLFIDFSGSVGINSQAYTAGAQEALLVQSINDVTYNLIRATGEVDNYIQFNIINTSTGTTASADIVATADNGTETSNYIDMGINNSQYGVQNAVGGPNDAYLYSTGNHLHIGNASPGQDLMFFVGDLDVEATTKLVLRDTNQHDVTGSLTVTEGVTGSLYGTASWAQYAITASYVSGAASNWDTLQNKPSGLVSSSTQINTGSFSGSFVGSLIGTSSWANNVISSSYATTASYALNAGAGAGFPFSGNAVITGSLVVSGSGITGSLFGTSSVAISSSFTVSSSIAVTSSFAITSSYIDYENVGNKPALISSSTQINTGSFSGSFTGTLIGTSSWASYAVTASYISGGLFVPNGLILSGSLIVSGSEIITGSLSVSQGITGSLLGTSSWAQSSSVAISSSRTVTSSFTTTASYAINADLLDGLNSTIFATTGSNIFVGNQTITGSLLTNADTLIFTGSMYTTGSIVVTGSINVSGGITGSLLGSSSFATTASAATSITFTPTTASYALTSSYIDGGLY